jgi:hypothetical protein
MKEEKEEIVPQDKILVDKGRDDFQTPTPKLPSFYWPILLHASTDTNYIP